MSIATYKNLRGGAVIQKSGKVSVLGYALLGLLARESLTGYELTGRMRERIGFFWGAGHSQVYPELARLEEGGLVEHRLVEQSDRPDKKVYTVTGDGFEALKEWVTAPVAPRPARDELTLKAYSLWVAGPGGVELFREEERRHAERLKEYRAPAGLDGRRVGREAPAVRLPGVRQLRRAAERAWLREGVCGVVPVGGGGP